MGPSKGKILETVASSRAIFSSSATCPYLNLAFEDFLFRRSPPDSHNLFLYRNTPCIVIGRNQNPWREANIPLLSQKGVAIVRRKSGGGAVYHDLGNTNYCIAMPRAHFSRDLNAELMASVLRSLGMDAKVNERHDIVVQDKAGTGFKKVSGSAYKITRERAYHHGTMLLSSNLEGLRMLLHSDVRNDINGRGVESVSSAVTNIDIPYANFIHCAIGAFQQVHGNCQVVKVDENGLRSIPEVSQTATEMKTPEFTIHLKIHIQSHAEVRLSVTSKKGIITDIHVGDTALSESLAQFLGQHFDAMLVSTSARRNSGATTTAISQGELSSVS